MPARRLYLHQLFVAMAAVRAAASSGGRPHLPAAGLIKCLLCDVDGSLVHYEDVLDLHGTMTVDPPFKGGTVTYTPLPAMAKLLGDGAPRPLELIALPASASGMKGFISRLHERHT